jgi:hypothetical protein
MGGRGLGLETCGNMARGKDEVQATGRGEGFKVRWLGLRVEG